MSKQTDFTKQISFSGAKGRGVQDSFTTVAKSGFVRYCRLTIVLNAMIRNREIKRWCQRVAREFRPEKIVLFGSYVRGTPTEDSDVDVLVVMPLTRGQRDVRQAVAIRERVRAALPMVLN